MQTWIIIESHLTDVTMHVWMQALKLGMLLQSISPLGGKFVFINIIIIVKEKFILSLFSSS